MQIINIGPWMPNCASPNGAHSSKKSRVGTTYYCYRFSLIYGERTISGIIYLDANMVEVQAVIPQLVPGLSIVVEQDKFDVGVEKNAGKPDDYWFLIFNHFELEPDEEVTKYVTERAMRMQIAHTTQVAEYLAKKTQSFKNIMFKLNESQTL